MSATTTTADESLQILAEYAQGEYDAINTAYQAGAQALQKDLVSSIESSDSKPTSPDEIWP